jgi:hypothetical protein
MKEVLVIYFAVVFLIFLILGIRKTIIYWKNPDKDGVDIFYWLIGGPLAGPFLVLGLLPLYIIILIIEGINYLRKTEVDEQETL